jgi:hypothetical protein
MMSDKSVAMLRNLVNSYSPEWHYEMGKVGYECAYCRELFRSRSEFHNPAEHRRGCEWVAASQLIEKYDDGKLMTPEVVELVQEAPIATKAEIINALEFHLYISSCADDLESHETKLLSTALLAMRQLLPKSPEVAP